MYKAFRKRPNYLSTYHIKSAAFWTLASGVVIAAREPSPSGLWFLPSILLLTSVSLEVVALGAAAAATAFFLDPGLHLSWIDAGLISLLGPWVLFATAILHNAAHGNFKPKKLNRLVGEVFGLFQLVGFPDWVIIHVIHHAHPDDPARDPHPPQNLSFWKFMTGMRTSILKVLMQEFIGLWGATPATKKQLTRLMVASRVEQFAKVAFCFLALGPHAFTVLFAPSVALKMIHYAWFNYATHQTVEATANEVAVVIVNRSSPIYRLANAFSFGLYYHRNHHKNPKLFDPSKMKSSDLLEKDADASSPHAA